MSAPVSDSTAVSTRALAAQALRGELNYQNQERDHAADESTDQTSSSKSV
jgi:hypothetical protein